jgi:hypothetical protein
MEYWYLAAGSSSDAANGKVYDAEIISQQWLNNN